MVLILFLLVLATLAGVLGTVLKAVFLVILTAVLATGLLVAIGVYAFKRKLERAARDMHGGRTVIEVGPPRAGTDRGLPGPRDDRY